MRILAIVAVLAAIAILAPREAAAMPEEEFEQAMREIAALQESGRLTEADARVQQLLAEQRTRLSSSQRNDLEFETERSRRIRRDYSLEQDRLLEQLADRIEDFTGEEYHEWLAAGKFDYKLIDGERRFVGPSVSNLFFRNPDIRARRADATESVWQPFLYEHAMAVMDEHRHTAQDTTKPRHFRLHMTITVPGGTVPEGRTIRTWMPFPQQIASQSGIELLSASPEPEWVNAPNYPARSIYFEQRSRGEEPTVFEAEYTLTTHPRWNPVDPDRVRPGLQRENPYFDYYTREQPPHVVFTPAIREKAEEIVGDETNPYLKARLIYNWISDNIQYSFAREYSTLRNISEYVLENRYGDCGQIALLYIALCRAVDVPARWQSGWVIYPQFRNLHDWTEILVEPYGWIPVDPNFGLDIKQRFDALDTEQRQELKDFFFGGMDAYRLVINSEHGYPHYPPRRAVRSDDVDFQRGELEAGGENIYFGDFRYRLEVEFLGGSDEAGAPATATAAGGAD